LQQFFSLLNAELIEQKKKAYRQYQQACDEMRDLLRTKANVKMILKMDSAQGQEQRNRTRYCLTNGGQFNTQFCGVIMSSDSELLKTRSKDEWK